MEEYKKWLGEQIEKCANDKDLQREHWAFCAAYGKFTELELSRPDIIDWVAFDWMKTETRPTEYGKYLICRKDGKIHWETWNGSGWAYNHNEISYWAVIVPPYS